MKLFEFAVIYTPNNTKEQIDAGITAPPELIVPITSVLAKDEDQAKMLAARKIPESHMDKLDRVQIAVRPF